MTAPEMNVRARPIDGEVYLSAADLTAFLRATAGEWRALAEDAGHSADERRAAGMASDYMNATADQLDCAAVQYATGLDQAGYPYRPRHERERQR